MVAPLAIELLGRAASLARKEVLASFGDQPGDEAGLDRYVG